MPEIAVAETPPAHEHSTRHRTSGSDHEEWTLTLEGFDPDREPARGALLTLANGRIGVRGAAAPLHPTSMPLVLAAGVYHRTDSGETLTRCPDFTRLPLDLGADAVLARSLDKRSGLLRHELLVDGRPVEVELFVSRARPAIAGLRARGLPPLDWPAPVLEPPRTGHVEAGRWGGREWQRLHGSGGVVVAASERRSEGEGGVSLERLASIATHPSAAPDIDEALEPLLAAEADGFERLFEEHRRAWEAAWRDADVRIEGDSELQRNVRFALFHLLASASEDGESAVAARGLSGLAYGGHVFWDADVFVLPFFAATRPACARAMIAYRANRLAAARAAARARGLDGARFPWESAREGLDVTPTEGVLPDGTRVPILTGSLEEHIVADVAWAVDHYLAWTGDEALAGQEGRAILAETARYWASRIRIDAHGRGHLDGVIGPDEYHENVDDNAFTNVMARWNLKRAAMDASLPEHERDRWRLLADALVDGLDRETGVYEQFRGFFDLEPIEAAGLAPIPFAADMLLGRERTRSSQILKQADVLMLHLLVPDEVEPGSLVPNLDFYLPRTAHGSSLSLPVHAALLARARRADEAADLLLLASRTDLHDLFGATADGLHLASMGGVWQALAFGFAGLRPSGDCLSLDPVLPARWDALELNLRYRGSRVEVRVEPDSLTVRAEPTIPIRVGPHGQRLAALPSGTVVSHESR